MNATFEKIYDDCAEYGAFEPEYYDKQVHKIPDAQVVDRVEFIVERCRDRTLMSIGCSGPLDQKILEVCKKCYGIDKELQAERGDFVQMDLDGPRYKIPRFPGVEFVLCGEVLEHLANPGRLLEQLKDWGLPVIITVPNAHSDSGQYWAKKQKKENVNIDHVCWYSWRTLKTLVERYGFVVDEFYWYNGKPITAEGFIFVVK